MQRNNKQLQRCLQSYRSKQRQWNQERQNLNKTITFLQNQISKQKALNSSFLKHNTHKRVSSDQQTFIFNQTNISSYYPIVVVKNNNWNHKTTLRSHLDSVRALAFVGNRLVTAGEDTTLKVWRKDTLQGTLREHLGPVYAISATEEHVFTAGAEGVVRKWRAEDLLNGLSPCFQEDYHEEPIWSLAYNKKKGLLLTSSADQSFKLLKNVQNGLEILWESKIKNDTPTAVEWLAENRFISGYHKKHALGVFQAQEGQLSWEYSYEQHGQQSQANCLQINSKIKMIAAGHEDHFIRFYDPNSNKKIKQIAAHSDAVTGLQFRGEGFQLVSCGHDGNLRFWDLRKYKCISDVAVHVRKYDEGALCLAENGEGLFAVGGADGLVKLFCQGE